MNAKWKIEERRLTKELVDKLIDNNVVYNRPLNKRRINNYAESMRNEEGYFFKVPTSMFFVVTEDDVLLDGQHRLYAIRESESYGFNAIFAVVPNKDAKIVYTLIDGGAKRTVSDILRDRSIATFIKGYFRQGNKGELAKQATSPLACSEYYDNHRKICDELIEKLVDTHGDFALRTGHKAAIFEQVVDFGASIEKISEFLSQVDACEIVQTRNGYKITSSPVNNLAVQLKVHHGTGGGSARERDDYIQMTEALKSYLNGTPCHKLNP